MSADLQSAFSSPCFKGHQWASLGIVQDSPIVPEVSPNLARCHLT
jgi:hypothetical protein